MAKTETRAETCSVERRRAVNSSFGVFVSV